MKKIRHICINCKGKKYQKYLQKAPKYKGEKTDHWICKNSEKCNKRSANYKK